MPGHREVADPELLGAAELPSDRRLARRWYSFQQAGEQDPCPQQHHRKSGRGLNKVIQVCVQGVIPGRKRQHYPDSPSAVGHVIPRAGEGSRPCPAPERRPPHPVQISDRSPLLKCVADSAPQHELLNACSTTCSGSCSTRSRSRSARTCSRPDGSSPARRLKSSASWWQPKHPATANSAVRSRVRNHNFRGAGGQASRSIGQLMHRGPPRPRPSSLPGTVITSMPWSRR